MSAYEPRIIGFLCHWCACAGADAAGRARSPYPANLLVVRVMCSGRVDPQFILQAFQEGADGVIILGCPSGSCHYKTGNAQALKRFKLLETILPPLGVDPRRLRLAWVGAEDAAGFVETVSEMTSALRLLENP